MKTKRLKLYFLLYWNTFLNLFKKKPEYDYFIYEDEDEVERNRNKKSQFIDN